MSILFGMAILGMTLYMAAHFSGSKNLAEEQQAAVPEVSEARQSPVAQPKPQPVPAPVRQPAFDEQKGTELNIQAHQLITTGKFLEAIPILEQALKSFPKDSTAPAYKYALYNLGHSLRHANRVKEAIPYLEQCVKMDPAWKLAQTELRIAQSQTKATQ